MKMHIVIFLDTSLLKKFNGIYYGVIIVKIRHLLIRQILIGGIIGVIHFETLNPRKDILQSHKMCQVLQGQLSRPDKIIEDLKDYWIFADLQDQLFAFIIYGSGWQYDNYRSYCETLFKFEYLSIGSVSSKVF